MSKIDDLITLLKVEKIAFVASGGFKDVFKINNQGTQEALKITNLYDPHIYDENQQEQHKIEWLARSQREFNLIKDLGGNNIVSLGKIPAQVIETNGEPFFVYTEEFLDGQTLDKVISNNNENSTKPDYELVKVFFYTGIDMLSKFDHLGLLNRDVKPKNVMCNPVSKRPFVFFDFGIAYDRKGSSLTVNTNAPGTTRYRAPETLDNDYKAIIDIRSDIFSLAITTFEFATGKHPIYDSESEGKTIYQLLNKSAAPLQDARPDFPSDFCDLINDCMKKRPALRPNISSINRRLTSL